MIEVLTKKMTINKIKIKCCAEVWVWHHGFSKTVCNNNPLKKVGEYWYCDVHIKN